MTPTFKHRNLPHLLLLVREQLMGSFRPLLRERGVTEQQWRVLRVLSESNAMEPNQLALACTLLSPSLTRMLSTMESAGLIHRERSALDHRRQNISLTQKSRELLVEMGPLVDAQYEAIEARLGETLTAELYAALDSALHRLDPLDAALAGHPAPTRC